MYSVHLLELTFFNKLSLLSRIKIFVFLHIFQVSKIGHFRPKTTAKTQIRAFFLHAACTKNPPAKQKSAFVC